MKSEVAPVFTFCTEVKILVQKEKTHMVKALTQDFIQAKVRKFSFGNATLQLRNALKCNVFAVAYSMC